jgi:hypothetical protein
VIFTLETRDSPAGKGIPIQKANGAMIRNTMTIFMKKVVWTVCCKTGVRRIEYVKSIETIKAKTKSVLFLLTEK